MKLKALITSVCLVLAGCGGDDPITIDEIAEEPGRKDVAMLCDLFVERNRSSSDNRAEAGFDEMAKLGMKEKGIKKARDARKKGREAYIEGIEECCAVFNKDVKALNDTQIAYVYADMFLSPITRDMITPAMRRQAQDLRSRSGDNMTRPENAAAFQVRKSIGRCEKEVANRTTKDTTEVIRQLIEEYK